MTEPVEWLRTQLKDGSFWVDMTRLTDGRVMCCICFHYFARDALTPVVDEPGRVWDVCAQCSADELAHDAERARRAAMLRPDDE